MPCQRPAPLRAPPRKRGPPPRRGQAPGRGQSPRRKNGLEKTGGRPAGRCGSVRSSRKAAILLTNFPRLADIPAPAAPPALPTSRPASRAATQKSPPPRREQAPGRRQSPRHKNALKTIDRPAGRCESIRQSQSRDTADKLSSACRHSRFRRSARLARKKARPREGNRPRDADKAHDTKTPSKPSTDLPVVARASVGRKAAILLTNVPRFADIPASAVPPASHAKRPAPAMGDRSRSAEQSPIVYV